MICCLDILMSQWKLVKQLPNYQHVYVRYMM